MLKSDQIRYLFDKLNEALARQGVVGEVGVIGGAVMCLVFNARDATRDVDAIFEPKSIILKLAQQIGEEEGVGENWLNDGAKGFIEAGFRRQEVIHRSHLRVWAPEADYMLAMKCISARWDTNDRDDVEFLIEYLALKSPPQVFKIVEQYYPKKRIPPKTQFLIEELFGQV